ncbi:TetR/AcrR family transcriptional regulator [Amycolatopsis eburnea]|uniref:TetR/AcrR family transcriptional regulator n=2 Tax=Amycolatopsis eburnea TaxID=2267691 RepID=A0A427T7Q9_9PSEU|nr:TetR/AcrR family transcriptional regulator [Amycolatopsis eburnea]
MTDRSSKHYRLGMGRRRAFDEDEVVRAAVGLFGGRAYDGVSVDDLVTHLGVHRNSLYKTFGSKRGLYLAALRRHLGDDVRPLAEALAAAPDAATALRLVTSADLGLLLLAAVERAPADEEVAAEVSAALATLDQAIADALGISPELAAALTAAALGIVLRGNPDGVGTALTRRFDSPD